MAVPLTRHLLYHTPPVEHPVAETPPEASADLASVRKAQAGDIQAFESLVRKYRNDVYALSYHFVHNREEAWDISQEVFIKAHGSLKKFRGDSSFKTWLLRITANHCKDFLKKRRLPTVSLDGSFQADAPAHILNPGERLEASELGAAIEAAINELPEKHRLAFILREFEGMSYQDMAAVMECNLGTVMSRLHHARQKLQNTLTRMGVVEVES